MKPLFKVPELEFTDINTRPYTTKNIRLQVTRLDKLHPIISGNKLFKLHYFIEEALQTNHKRILTFGGAWSNHLLATAYACKLAGIVAIGIVRGDDKVESSNTLKECERLGMKLKFIPREAYRNKEDPHFLHALSAEFGDCLIIPEGGFHPLGAKGASLIMDHLLKHKPTHVCTAVGTATTLAGLLAGKQNSEKIIAVPVLKNMTDIEKRVSSLNITYTPVDLILFDEYHFGGYAKQTTALLDFMNYLYLENKLPTDFVYTAKMMYAITDKIKNDFFDDGSSIICLHTGGLQGNSSLPVGSLVF